MRTLIVFLFCANQLFAQDNPLVGSWILIDECHVPVKGDLSTMYCLSELNSSRDAHKIFYEDGTYEIYYKFKDWERALDNITSPDFTFGTYVVNGNELTYSEKRMRGAWEFSIDKIGDKEVLVLHNVEGKNIAYYLKVREIMYDRERLNADLNAIEVGRKFLKELKAQGPSLKKLGQTFIRR